MNIVIVSGNLTKDIELRYLNDGTALAHFSIAVNEKYKDKEQTHFFEVTVWGKTAENCAKYLGKGSKVLVQGSLKQESWEKDGQKHYRVKINAHRIEFIGKPRGQAEPGVDQTQEAPEVNQTEDVPF